MTKVPLVCASRFVLLVPISAAEALRVSVSFVTAPDSPLRGIGGSSHKFRESVRKFKIGSTSPPPTPETFSPLTDRIKGIPSNLNHQKK